MLRTLSPAGARLVALTIVLLLAACFLIRPDTEITSGKDAKGQAYSDIRLYHDVVARMAKGDAYYPAVTSLHREHGFPTRPAITVRLPTLATLAASMGWPVLRGVLTGLLLVTALAWFATLRNAAPAERIGAALMVVAGGAMVSQPDLAAQHELWAGTLVTLALALRGAKAWGAGWLATAAALAIRELALPLVLLAALCAFVRRRTCEGTAYALLATTFLVALSLHIRAVMAHALPGDLPSQGWLGLRGIAAPLRDIVDVSVLGMIPRPLAYAVALLAPLGWAAMPDRRAPIALAWLAGFSVVLMAFARPVNFYWAIMLTPAWFIGFAFVPRALSDVAHAALAGPRADR